MTSTHDQPIPGAQNQPNRQVDESGIDVNIQPQNIIMPASRQQLQVRNNVGEIDEYRCSKFTVKAIIITIIVVGSFSTGLTFIIISNKSTTNQWPNLYSNSSINTFASITTSCGGYGPQFLIVNKTGCSGCSGTITNGTCTLCTDKINNQFTGIFCNRCIQMSNNTGYCGYCSYCYPIYLSLQCYSGTTGNYQTIILNSTSCNNGTNYRMQCIDMYDSNKIAYNCYSCLNQNGTTSIGSYFYQVGFCQACLNCYF